jgi:ABC-type nitrate/sulfonate/bicarbonate transport system substrate-binding protein
MRSVLAHHGLDPDKDVNIIGLGARYPQVTALFDSGELQAAVLSEPNISIGEDGGHFRVMQSLTDAEFCPGMQWSVIVANQVVMEREPELVRAVLRGCVRSYRHAAAHPDELAEFGADYFRITPATMHKSIRREADGLHTECEVDLPGLQQAIALQQRLGAFSVPLDANAIVDARYLPGAAPGVASGVAPGAAA